MTQGAPDPLSTLNVKPWQIACPIWHMAGSDASNCSWCHGERFVSVVKREDLDAALAARAVASPTETPLTQLDQRENALTIASALESKGLLCQTLNGSDTIRQQTATIIERHFHDLYTLVDYLLGKVAALHAASPGLREPEMEKR